MSMIRVEKRGHGGELKTPYDGEVIERGETYVVVSAVFNRDDRDDGYFVWQRGDRFLEWFYTDRYYNIFKIMDRDTGEVRGWYCNITRPAVIRETIISSEDLELDIFVYPSGEVRVIDESEFNALDLPAEERARALEAAEEIRRLARTAPFDR